MPLQSTSTLISKQGTGVHTCTMHCQHPVLANRTIQWLLWSSKPTPAGHSKWTRPVDIKHSHLEGMPAYRNWKSCYQTVCWVCLVYNIRGQLLVTGIWSSLAHWNSRIGRISGLIWGCIKEFPFYSFPTGNLLSKSLDEAPRRKNRHIIDRLLHNLIKDSVFLRAASMLLNNLWESTSHRIALRPHIFFNCWSDCKGLWISCLNQRVEIEWFLQVYDSPSDSFKLCIGSRTLSPLCHFYYRSVFESESHRYLEYKFFQD